MQKDVSGGTPDSVIGIRRLCHNPEAGSTRRSRAVREEEAGRSTCPTVGHRKIAPFKSPSELERSFFSDIHLLTIRLLTINLLTIPVPTISRGAPPPNHHRLEQNWTEAPGSRRRTRTPLQATGSEEHPPSCEKPAALDPGGPEHSECRSESENSPGSDKPGGPGWRCGRTELGSSETEPRQRPWIERMPSLGELVELRRAEDREPWA